MTAERRHLPSLDGIRGVAALLIVLRHTYPFFGGVSFSHSYLAVDLFFVLSGFVLGSAYDPRLRTTMGGGRFLLLRFLRLFPLYLVGLLLSCGAEIVGRRHGVILTEHWKRVAALSLFMLPRFGEMDLYPLNPPAWSLLFELLANLCYGFSARLLTLRRMVALTGLSGLGLFGWALFTHGQQLYVTLDAGFDAKTMVFGVFRVLYSFSAGLLIYRLERRQDPDRASRLRALAQKHARWMLVSVIATTLLVLMVSPPKYQLSYDLICVLFVFPLVVCAAVWSDITAKKLPVLTFLGVISYALYVVHVPAAKLILVQFELKTGVPIILLAPWVGFALLGILVPLAWLLEVLIDLPIRRFVGKRLGGAGSRAVSVERSPVAPPTS